MRLYELPDYRSALRAWLAGDRRSQTTLARRVGVSRSTVAMVLRGDRNIALPQARAWGEAIGLVDADDLAYWEALVRMEHGETLALRRAARLHVRAMREYRNAPRPPTDVSELLGRWYVPVLVELSRLPDFRLDPGWLREHLWPEVDPAELAEVLEPLKATGLLDQEGPLATERELAGDLAARARRYHTTQLDHAKEALEVFPSTERYFASLTVAVRGDRIPALLSSLHRFQLEAIEPLRADTPDTVVQIGLQLFPRSPPRAKRSPA